MPSLPSPSGAPLTARRSPHLPAALALSVALALAAPAIHAADPAKASAARSAPASAAPAQATPAFRLEQLVALAVSAHPASEAARAQRDAAAAGIDTARAFPNPEVEYLAGNARPNQPGTSRGNAYTVAVTQPLDLPWVRAARIGTAQAGLRVAEAEYRGFLADVTARVRLHYYEVLRRDAELAAAREDLQLMEDIHGRIALQVSTGEAARYELIKADAEMLSARNRAKSAAFRVTQAKAALRQYVGQRLPADFALDGGLPTRLEVPPLERLRDDILARNPDLARSREAAEQAEARLSLERSLRTPTVALKASRDNDPDVRNDKLGVVVTIPLWDRRSGPVAEAAAQARRSRYALEEQRFTLLQSLEGAYHQYEIATSQVAALETGIVHQAENALKVAEAAYRYGERGILDYLDAQRVYRAARNELIAARFELAAAVVELERLRTAPDAPTATTAGPGDTAASAPPPSSPISSSPAASGR